MIKRFRLEFIPKKPALLQSAWRELIDAGLLTNTLGVLSGSFLGDSSELSRILAWFERDREKLGLRMEASCQASCEESDLNSYSHFKLYPPDIELIHNQSKIDVRCEECGRIRGCDHFDSLALIVGSIVPDSAVAMTNRGSLLLREDLVEYIGNVDCLIDLQLRKVNGTKSSLEWSLVECAPIALRIGVRAGYCSSCGNAVKCGELPDIDETYSGDTTRNFFLSPDQPRLPCFSAELARLVIDVSSYLSWSHFKPVQLQPS